MSGTESHIRQARYAGRVAFERTVQGVPRKNRSALACAKHQCGSTTNFDPLTGILAISPSARFEMWVLGWIHSPGRDYSTWSAAPAAEYRQLSGIRSRWR